MFDRIDDDSLKHKRQQLDHTLLVIIKKFFF